MSRTSALVASLLIALGTPVRAQTVSPAVPEVGVPERQDVPDPAIGRFNFAGYRSKRHCTMFAVGPTTVLTAAHCVRGLRAGETHLLFGYSRMEWGAHLTPASIGVVGNDVAVLCLREPAPAALALAPEAPLEPGEAVVAVGYGTPVRHMQSRTRCPVLREGATDAGRSVVLGCAQSHGASGGPVLNGRGEAVAVISATSRTQLLAARIPPGAAELCAPPARPGEAAREAVD